MQSNWNMKMDVIENWQEIKKIFNDSFRSSFHFSIATINKDGSPHITPIGSLILGKAGSAIYFEKFTQKIPINGNENKKICVLAVNSGKLFWLKSLLFGGFSKPPAIRLYGKLGNRRKATEKEIKLWQKRVKSVSFTKGHKLMWVNMKTVRELSFDQVEPVQMGEITRQAWKNFLPIKDA